MSRTSIPKHRPLNTVSTPTPTSFLLIIEGAAVTTIDVRNILGEPTTIAERDVTIVHRSGSIMINDVEPFEVCDLIATLRARVRRHESANQPTTTAPADHFSDVGNMVEPDELVGAAGNSSESPNSSPGAAVVAFEDLPQRGERPTPQFRPITHLPGLGAVVPSRDAMNVAANFAETISAAERVVEGARFADVDDDE